LSDIFHVHHNNYEVILVVGILELQDCLEVDMPSTDPYAQVKVKPVVGIFRPLFRLLVDLPAEFYVLMQNATDSAQRLLRQFAAQPLLRALLEHNIVRIPGDKSVRLVPQDVPVTAQPSLLIVGKHPGYSWSRSLRCRDRTGPSHMSILALSCIKSTQSLPTRID
jgi:hypothetical protein